MTTNAATSLDRRVGDVPAELSGRLDRIEALLGKVLEALDRRAGVVTEAAFRAGLRCDGFDDEIRITAYEPRAEAHELHAHPFSARVFVLEGEFVLRDEDGEQVLTAGQCCEVPAGTRHAEAAGPAGARVLAGLHHGG
jgi:quercetin dioxygenase-like cupin family protein